MLKQWDRAAQRFQLKIYHSRLANAISCLQYSLPRLCRWRRISLTLLCLTVTVGVASGCGETELEESLVRIIVETSSDGPSLGLGSGFVVASGYVATNHHVIDTGRLTRKRIVVFREGTERRPYTAYVRWSSPQLDLAILEVPELNAPSLAINDGEIEKEDPVRAAGFPVASDIADTKGDAIFISTRTSGQVSRFFKADWNNSGRHIGIIQHTAAVNPGNSGGPLVNRCNEVVGINTFIAAAQLERTGSQGIRVDVNHSTFFAPHAKELASALRVQGITADTRSRRCGADAWSSSATIAFAIVGSLLGFMALLIYTPRFAGMAPAWLPVPSGKKTRSPEVTEYTRPLLPPWLIHGKLPDGGGDISFTIDESRIGKSGSVILGRDAAFCDLVVAHPTVSSRGHAKIYRQGDRLMVADLRSTNGTKADGTKLGESGNPAAVPLRHGMTLSLGSVRFNVTQA